MTENSNKKSNLRVWLLHFGLMLFILSACVAKQVNPDLLQSLPEDKAVAEFPPDPDELIPPVYQVITLVAEKDATVTDTRLEAINSFIKSGFTKYSHIKNINSDELENKLSEKAYHTFQPGNVAQGIQLGKELNARYIAQVKIAILEAKLKENIDRYKAEISFTVFTTDGGQNLFNEKIQYDSADLKDANKKLKTIIQTHFPLKGFILETRGAHQVARLSIGRNVGVKLNREFFIRSRKVESTVTYGLVQKVVTLSNTALAIGKVIKVMENESWISIPESDRTKVKIGLVATSKPEKSDW